MLLQAGCRAHPHPCPYLLSFRLCSSERNITGRLHAHPNCCRQMKAHLIGYHCNRSDSMLPLFPSCGAPEGGGASRGTA